MRGRPQRFVSLPQRRARAPRARGSGQPPVSGFVDLIVTDIIIPSTPAPGDHVVFQVVVKNQGTMTMPAGLVANNQQLDCAVQIDGSTVAWSDQYEGTLAAGASLTMTMTGGPLGVNYWTATAGSHLAHAIVNSAGIPRKTESTLANNTFDKSFTVVGSPPPGAQPLLAWLGTVDLDGLVGGGTGGISLSSLQTAGFAGSAVSLGVPNSNPFPTWQLNEWTEALTKGQLGVGWYIASLASPIPTDATGRTNVTSMWTILKNAANSVGMTRSNMDCEPYNYPGGGDLPANNPWCSVGPLGMDSTKANAFGQALGSVVALIGNGQCVCYCSSNASWPGSNNDQIRANVGNPNTYATNKFADFIDGLITAGVIVTICDASFHWGIQNPAAAGDYVTAIQIHKTAVTTRFPAAKASIMGWPDNTEGHGFFSPSEIATQVSANVTTSNGPGVIYQQQLATGTQVAYWNSVLAAIDGLGL